MYHRRFICLILLAIIALSACAPTLQPEALAPTAAAPTAAPATHEATKPAPTATDVPAATATAAPTDAPAATATIAATAAPVTGQAAGPLAVQAIKELSGWCLAADAAVSYAKDPLLPNKSARMGRIGQNTLTVRNMPSNGCTFLYTFTQNAPSGLKLEISTLKETKPFLTVDLQPTPTRADVVYTFIRHSYVINPPGSGVSLNFVVKDALGQVLRRDQVNLNNWLPGTPAPGQEADEGDCGCTLPLP